MGSVCLWRAERERESVCVRVCILVCARVHVHPDVCDWVGFCVSCMCHACATCSVCTYAYVFVWRGASALAHVYEWDEYARPTTLNQTQVKYPKLPSPWQLGQQPASKKPRTAAKAGQSLGGAAAAAERRDVPPDFATGTCAEATWWAPSKVMPALGACPIGHIRTCFPRKNGCPRQGSVCPSSLARLELCFGNNPHHGHKPYTRNPEP